ncbi:MAG TPA: replicative DNA helicase loader DnaI [Lachnospiraceae bacterium]|jgi:DNA replication protein DnaC|nr:replicative DNA helicase loader DnaI [Lachnospiraceae bacterium]
MIIKDIEKIDIQAELSKIRSSNEREHLSRLSEVYEKIPAIKEIDSSISSLSIEEAKARILKKTVTEDISDKINELSLQKKKLLSANGYDSDYLEPIYSCKLCKDEGFVNGHICSCVKNIRARELYNRSNLNSVFKRENFSTFSLDVYSKEKYEGHQATPYQNASIILKRAINYVKNFDSEHGNILIYGRTGLGKTFISNCIAKELLDNAHSVLYLSANELFEQILSRYIMTKERSSALTTIYEYVYDSELLIIDDLGTEVLSSFVKSQLFEILNKRMINDKATIITTNLDLATLEDRYGERIMSRIAKDYVLYPLYGDDIRYHKTNTP